MILFNNLMVCEADFEFVDEAFLSCLSTLVPLEALKMESVGKGV